MSSKMPPVPHTVPMTDATGAPSPVWSDFFKQLLRRIGGPTALTNLELASAPVADGSITTAKLADGAVTTIKLADLAVTTAKIAANAVTGPKLNSNVVDNSSLQLVSDQLSVKAAGITQAMLASAVANALCPAGSLLAYAGNSAPTGFLLCDGSAVSRTTYAALFTAISTTYGVGDGSTTFNLPNTQGVFLRGAGSQTISGISYSGTLGAVQGDQMQGHIHAYTTSISNGVGSGSPNQALVGSNQADRSYNTGSPASDGTNGTPRTGTETRPANVGVNWIIKT